MREPPRKGNSTLFEKFALGRRKGRSLNCGRGAPLKEKGPTYINNIWGLHFCIFFSHYFVRIEVSLRCCSAQEKHSCLAQEFQAKLSLISKNFKCLPIEALGESISRLSLEFVVEYSLKNFFISRSIRQTLEVIWNIIFL